MRSIDCPGEVRTSTRRLDAWTSPCADGPGHEHCATRVRRMIRCCEHCSLRAKATNEGTVRATASTATVERESHEDEPPMNALK